MSTFCIFDVSNLVYRVASMTMNDMRSSDEDTINLSLSNTIKSMRIPFEKFKANHAVMCFDNYSWRKRIYEQYKSNRSENLTEDDIAVKNAISSAISDFRSFLQENSNCTVLWVEGCEADDLIARWIKNHPNDTNIIVSSDSDFKQLVYGDVHLFNATSGVLCSGYGIYESCEKKRLKRGEEFKELFGDKWRVVLDKETGKPEKFDPGWILFKKIMTGDKSDNIFRAAPPRTRTDLMREAYNHWGGIAWTDLMSMKRLDLPNEPTVADVYERNRNLIDFELMPENISTAADEAIKVATAREVKRSLGMKFMMFCRQRNMVSLGIEVEKYVPMLSSNYQRPPDAMTDIEYVGCAVSEQYRSGENGQQVRSVLKP